MQNPQCLLCLVLCLLSSSVVGEGRHLRGCQRRRLQRVCPALGSHHFEEPESLNNISFLLRFMRNLTLKYFLVNPASSGMFLERETWATSSQRGRRSPQRCKRALTRPLILGEFLLSGWRLAMLMMLGSLMMITLIKTPIDYHDQRY